MFVLSTGEHRGSLRNAVSNQFLLAIIAFRLFVPCAVAKNLVNVYVILRVAYRLIRELEHSTDADVPALEQARNIDPETSKDRHGNEPLIS